MTRHDFLRELEDALELQYNSITGNEDLTDLGSWDSMAALSFLAMVDKVFGITISGDQLQQCKSVPDLIRLLGDKITG